MDAVESRRQGGRRLAHPGLGQVDGDGALHQPVMRAPELLNPTVVVITDRKELDGQLYAAFAASLLLPRSPSRSPDAPTSATELSDRTTGGIYFTTLQKFGRARDERTPARSSAAVRPAQHHRHRRRGAPQPLRRPRRLRPPPQGRPAARDPDRVHRHPDLLRRPQHPCRLRRLHRLYDLTRAVDDGATVPVYFEPA